jgi:uncharacterized protein (TIGR02246 family)
VGEDAGTEAITEGLARTWSSGDADAYAACFAEDAAFVDALGRLQLGRSTIAAEHRKLFETIYAGSRLTVWTIGSRDLGAGLHLVHVGSSLSVPAGPRAGVVDAIQTLVVRAGLIESFHNTAVSDVGTFAGHDERFGARAPQGWSADGG